MKRLFQLLLVCFTLLASSAIAQVVPPPPETVCNNYLDDDGDGFIDCFDSDCSSNSLCDDFYLGNDAACQLPDPPSKKFTMTMDFSSPNETTNHLSRMAIGDLNRDGVPEIITMNRYTKRLFILNGNDGTIQSQATVAWEPQWEIAIANVDNDGCAEIFFFGVEGGSFFLYAYDCNLNFIWKSAQKLLDDPVNYGLADFDSDGKVELYAKDEIFDAHTGVRIVKSATTTSGGYNKLNGGPVAVDMDNDGKLELVMGLSIFKVNLGARTADVGSLTLFKKEPTYFVRYPFNATSVADYNLDGFLDVIASGSTIANGTNTTVFFWDVQNNTVKTFSDPIAGTFSVAGCPASSGAFYKNGWQNGTGRINLADLDGDGKMNASYVSGKFLYALKEDFSLLWRVPVNEETSGYTGCTLFDFNGDGESEIVYRDEKFIYIINGKDGSVNTQQACVSRTNREYPIVADVDADGSTEICVTCGFDDALAVANFCNINYSQYSHVRVFKSNSEPWVPARRLWNQHGYFNVNVNNDLTIPRVQQKHHLAFSAVPCKVGQNIIPRPLNNFLNQSPYLDSKGCQVNVAPDLGFVNNSLVVNSPTCPDQNFTVSFSIENKGDAPISGDLPITFYSGNPNLAGAIKLNTITVTLVALSLNDVFAVNNAAVSGPGSTFELYIVLNDDGSTVPTPIQLAPDFIECNYINNVEHATVTPLPVDISALKVQDNIVCNSGVPPNGAARAFILTGGVENTIDYNFYWSNGLIAKPVPADFVGPIYSGLAAGDFTVYAIHKTANCGSDTAVVSPAVADVTRTLNITIDLLSADTKCQNSNGQLRAVVNGGEPSGNFTYEWYVGPTVGGGQLVSNAPVASNLKGGITPYTVLVTEKSTGCSNSASLAVPDNTVKPVAQIVVTDIVCSNANSGAAAATVGGVTAGFKFNWYKGSFPKPTTDFPGSTTTGIISSQPTGNYTLVVIDNSSKCESDPVTITIKQTPSFVVTTTKTSDQTSCDVSLPNGSASANVSTGALSDYTFEWFRGQNTLPANFIDSISNTQAGMAVGVYTVRARNRITKCIDTEEVTINFAVVTPNLVLAAVGGLTNCTTPDGSVKVTVSLDKASDYTFSWYDGASVKVTPDYPDTDSLLTNLPVGTYTVEAVHNTKHCSTGPITAKVVDNTPIISITLDAAVTQPPSDCNSNNGVMKVNVSAPGNTLGFKIEWFAGVAPLTTTIQPPDNGVTSSIANALPSGIYTVLATNLDNGCSRSQSFNLPFLNAHLLNYVSQVDVDKCAPINIGSITVDLIKSVDKPGSTFFESDYIIELRSGTLSNGALIQTINGVNGQIPYTTVSTLTPGFYNLIAISNNVSTPGCKSVPVIVEIKQVVSDPVIAASSITNNTNCAGVVTANGQIQLDIDGPVAPESDYTYVWHNGTSVASPVLGAITTSIASNLPSGSYTVEVTKIAGTFQGCSAIKTFQIFDNPPIITLTATDISITDNLRCDILTGAAIINSVSETVNGVVTPVPVATYSFEWFDVNLVSLLSGPNTIGSLTPGTYFVQATSTTNNCASTMLMFEIKDMTTGDPTVNLISFVDPTKCLKPTNILGELHVSATGTSAAIPPFLFNWYAGPTATGPVVSTSPDLIGIDPLGQPNVTFTIEVINNTSKCRVTDTYVLPVVTSPILLTASASSLTFCNTPYDGSVFATITSGSQNQYTYNWYDETVKALPDFTSIVGTPFTPLDSGNYIVIAVDQLDATCTASDTVTITNERVFPKLIVQSLRSLSVCDLTFSPADGVAEASIVGEDVINYTFAWYRNDFPPLGNQFASATQVGGLADSTYFVVASQLVTGCSDSTSVTILKEPLPIPFPQITILSEKTSCIEDNGALSASVGGNTKDYIFDWFRGTGTDTTYLSTGEMIDSLSVDFYTVTATSRETGCVSIPVSDQIREQTVFPDFNFKIEPATCDQEDGFLTLFMTTTDVEIDSIVWTGPNGMVITGPNVVNAPAGTYSVAVITNLGCKAEKSIELLTEIKPYNGVSVNGDAKNPIFQIDCIQNFPDNVVKIFNRAGTLVYEASGYDNQVTFFDGKSNKGISLMGTQLPGGTYFYVIDKRDGSKALAGYLEVVN
ncbi:MAG: gliding motility-associated C-terminal domain-containing protein [Chryseolinea sp.]